MGSNNEVFDVKFTDECIKELTEIYEYISNNLQEDNIAKKLMTEVMDRVLTLAYFPERYMKIEKLDNLKREYHRMIVKNYVVLYTIDKERNTVYVSHMIYGGRNYL